MFNQQVNLETPRYPVDRYLVERSNKLEMVNIIDDDIWNADPALRPEDENALRKLHDMLQSTADDLKLLTGELSKYHEPGIQVKSLPIPLDDDFNEKVHIKELVTAKFHGNKIVNKFQPMTANAPKQNIAKSIQSLPTETYEPKKVIEAGIQVNQVPICKKHTKKNNLTVTRTKVTQINECNSEQCKQQEQKSIKPTIAYKEVVFKYTEPNNKLSATKPLQVQNMPSINIRGELKEQKVLNLNIEPGANNKNDNDISKNIAIISVRHESVPVPNLVSNTNLNEAQCPTLIPSAIGNNKLTRKFSKMSSCNSSEVEYNNIDLTAQRCFKMRPQTSTKTVIKLPPKQRSEVNRNKSTVSSKKQSIKHSNLNLDVWKKKLNALYGCTTSNKKSKLVRSGNNAKKVEAKPVSKINQNMLNNSEYIPYSKLTLGGVRISDIEKELSDISNRNDVTPGPILNKILSRENSFHNETTPGNICPESSKILTTSDENLLREVLDIEDKVSKQLMEPNCLLKKDQSLTDADEPDSYVDDFEDENFEHSAQSRKSNQLSDDALSVKSSLDKTHSSYNDNGSYKNSKGKVNSQNKICTKTLNLSLKRNVDIFEFIHNIETQDTGTQSITTQKISLKETQTSPRNERSIVHPIHNDLRLSIDPKGEVEALFQLEKDFIKKLIVDEYGDLVEKNLNKPSTSKSYYDEKNVTAHQKNTQTSPSQVKSVMTSPTKTKTRTTSPFTLSLKVDQQTSPMSEELRVNIEDGDELGISINLSSPRFSLRLPQTTREVISNLESHAESKSNKTKNNLKETRVAMKNTVSSSTSEDGDYSSSDISSLGEVRYKLRQLRKLQVSSLSEFSSSTSLSKYGSDISDPIILLRSEGELSLGQTTKRKPSNNDKSEGEANVN